MLIHQIENRTCEKTLHSQTNFEQTLPAEIGAQAKLALAPDSPRVVQFGLCSRAHNCG